MGWWMDSRLHMLIATCTDRSEGTDGATRAGILGAEKTTGGVTMAGVMKAGVKTLLKQKTMMRHAILSRMRTART